MPAIAEEIEGLLEEGIEIQFLTVPVKIHIEDNTISKVECLRMELGEIDASGRRKPVPIAGSNFFVEAQQVFTAIGETSDVSFLDNRIKLEKWGICADEFGRTDNPKIFAGGDVATGAGTVTHAIGSGRRTAIAIRCFLEGGKIPTNDLLPPSLQKVNPHIVTFKNLNINYFDERQALILKRMSPNRRKGNFLEINFPINENQALYEAQRCFSCGTCPDCDNCFVFCPDSAIMHNNDRGKGYLIDIKHCKGCGLCFAECPRYCIEFNLLR
jgi:NADPH-dependent glutamate synthase beta subunit-like oxidoreductase